MLTVLTAVVHASDIASPCQQFDLSILVSSVLELFGAICCYSFWTFLAACFYLEIPGDYFFSLSGIIFMVKPSVSHQVNFQLIIHGLGN